jgi:rubrerythrin
VGFLADWILRRVVKSALAFETSSLETYRQLREHLVDSPLWESLSHLLEEEEHHWRILTDAAAGRLDAAQIERVVQGHLFSGMAAIRPLESEALGEWGPVLERARVEEERTLLFYGNLRRMSRIPIVRRAFEVLAAMEREHVEILHRLLGRQPGSPREGTANAPVVDSTPAGE